MDWEQQTDPNTGKTFYVNHATQQTSWTLPVDLPLPPGWVERRDNEGRTYFFHAAQNKTSWQDPRLAAPATSSAYPSMITPTSFPSAPAPTMETRFQLQPSSSFSNHTSSNNNTWTCPSCTLENKNTAVKCQVCDTGRPGGGGVGGGVMSDEAVAAALQAELDGEFAYEQPKSSASAGPVTTTADAVSEPFELQPNMVPDETSPSCLKCGTLFGTFTNRRHHCRCCGILSCHACSSKRAIVRLPLNKEELNEKEQRCCNWCFDHLNDGHAHCLYRYVVLASREDYEQRALAIRGMADVMENLPQHLSRASDRAQALRDLEVLKFVGGVPKMCSFLSPGDTPKAQTEACRLLVALASASCVPELDQLGLPKRQVASELCEGAALSIMSRILTRTVHPGDLIQIYVVRILYLLGDVPALKQAVREADLIAPLCECLLSEDSQLQDWACMTLGKLIKADKQVLEQVLANQGVQKLILVLGSTNSMIQEHAALALQEALLVNGEKVKRAMHGFSGTAACVQLIKGGEAQVISAGLRLLLMLPEQECAQIRSFHGVPVLVGIMGNAAHSDNQILALQVLCHIANASSLDRHAIAQSGGLVTAVDLMKSSQNSFVKREATNLVDILSNDADGASQIVQASGGIQNLVSSVQAQADNSTSASNALSLLMLQGADAQQAMLSSGALDALLGAVTARGDVVQASRVVEATFSFVSDPALVPKLISSASPVTLMQRLLQLANALQAQLPPHTIEMLLLVLAMLCNAKPTDYQMNRDEDEQEQEEENLLQPTANQCRNMLCTGAGSTLVLWVRNFTEDEPGVALAALRCLVASTTSAENADRLCSNGALQATVQSMSLCMRFGNELDSAKCQVLLHGMALFARLLHHSSTSTGNQEQVRNGLVQLNEGLALAEPECMLTAVRALHMCSIQPHTWKTIAEYSLPRCLEMLLADKSKRGPGGRDPLSSSQVLQLLMDVSEICRNLSQMEVYSNAILDGGGVLALVALLTETEVKCTASGINTLLALSTSSKRCAQAVAQNATLALLHLQESNLNGNAPLALLRKLAETDASTASTVATAAGKPGLDILLRLVQFDQNEDALLVLCHTSAASDLVWDHLVDSGEVATAVLMLNATTSKRVQGKCCRALAVMCAANISLYTTNDLVLGTALPIMIGFLSPVDVLGSDKTESPAMEAAWALAHLCETSVNSADEVARTALATKLEEFGMVQGAVTLVLRERRLARSKSASTAHALHAVRYYFALQAASKSNNNAAAQADSSQFWLVASSSNSKTEDLFSALVMALDANLSTVGSSDTQLGVIDDVCWLLATFPGQGISTEALQRLSRPLTLALDKSMSHAKCRLSCLRAMARAIREPALSATSLAGSVRGVTAALLNGMEEDQQIETALLLASLLRGANAQDRLIQDMVANCGAVPLLMGLLDSAKQTEAVSCLATMIEFGGNPVKRAIRKVCGEEELIKLKGLVENEEGGAVREHALRLVARLASLDDGRQEFQVFKSTCFHLVEAREPATLLKPAIELLTWLELDGETALEQMLLDLAADKSLQDRQAKLEALQALGYFANRTSEVALTFSPVLLAEFKQEALFALRAVCARIDDFASLLPALLALAKEQGDLPCDLVAQCVFEAAHKDASLRAKLYLQGDLIRVLRDKANLAIMLYSQRLLRLLGEEFTLTPKAPQQQVVSKPQQMVDKRKQDATLSAASAASTPPPPAAPRGVFRTFSGPQSAQEKSSLDLALRLQQLEQQQQAPPLPPPSISTTTTATMSSNKWTCSTCTLENESMDSECAACGTAKPGNGGGSNRNLNSNSSTTRVRCQNCMQELLALSTSPKFKCSTCGQVAQVRDCKI